jgi:hypothetical protein
MQEHRGFADMSKHKDIPIPLASRWCVEGFRSADFMTGAKLRYQHKGHAGISRANTEERLESFQSAGGCADADDGEIWGTLVARVAAVVEGKMLVVCCSGGFPLLTSFVTMPFLELI